MSARGVSRSALGAAAIALLVAASVAGAGVSAPDRAKAKLPKALWAVEVDARSARTLSVKRLAALRAAGINAVVADSRRIRPRTLNAFRRRAARARLLVIVPKMRKKSGAAVMARTTREARSLARAKGVGLVVVRVSGPAQASSFTRGSAGKRVLVLSRLVPSPRRAPQPWRGAISVARTSAALDLGVSTASQTQALNSYLSLLREPAGDLTPPTVPSGLNQVGATRTSASLSWRAASDDSGVAGYDLFRNDAPAGSTAGTSYELGGLACGTSYKVSVVSKDRSGKRSAPAVANATTLACALPELPSLDLIPPTPPGNVRVTSTGTTAIRIAWDASIDLVGVAGYNLYRDGVPAGTTQGLSHAFTGLVCGSSYRFDVEAYDAAGNKSLRSGITPSTSACGSGPPPVLPELVAAYGFEEASGANVVDASGNANSGSIRGAVRTTGGRFGSALSFDGVDDRVTVNDAPSLDLRDKLTIEAWVRPTVAGGWRTVVLKEQADDLVYALYAGATGGRPSGHVFTTADLRANAPSTLPVDTWSHLAMSWDGALIRLYVNGSQVATAPAVGTIPASDDPLRIGGNDIWDEWFRGVIDEVRIFSTVRSQAQIASDMNAPVSGGGPPDSSPPTQPGNFRTTGQTTTSISLAWNASSDNVGVTEYRVYRGGSLAATTSGTTATVGSLTCGTSYTFEVKAYDAAGNPSSGATVGGSTSVCPPPDNSPPTQPGNFRTTGQTTTDISLAWDASSDDVGVVEYRVLRNGAQAATTASTSVTVGSLTCGTSYAFEVRAYDAGGNPSTAASLTASTSVCPPPDLVPPTQPGNFRTTAQTTTSLSLAWDASTDENGVDEYRITRNGTQAATTSGTSATIGSLNCGTSYALEVRAYDAANNGSAPAALTASTSACPPPPPPGSTLHVSTTGADTNACTAAAPCKTLDRAWRVAQAGQTIEFAAGTYGGQTLPAVAKPSSAKIIIKPAAGSAVTVSSLSLWGKNAEFQDFKVNNSAYWHCDADNIDFIRGQMGLFFIRSADEIDMIGTQIGPWAADSDSDIGTAEDCREANANLVFDNVLFIDHTSSNPPNGAHKQCLAVTAIDGLTIRNSKFIRCEDFNILFKRYGPVADLKNITLINNFFGDPYPDGTSAIQFSSPDGDDYTNVLIQNNSFGATLTLKPDNRYLNTRVIGNAGTKYGGPCGSGLIVHHNVWGDQACSGDFAGNPLFVNNTTDLHLQAGSPAINRGDPAFYPAFDIDGEARPKGGAPDAGADER